MDFTHARPRLGILYMHSLLDRAGCNAWNSARLRGMVNDNDINPLTLVLLL